MPSFKEEWKENQEENNEDKIDEESDIEKETDTDKENNDDGDESDKEEDCLKSLNSQIRESESKRSTLLLKSKKKELTVSQYIKQQLAEEEQRLKDLTGCCFAPGFSGFQQIAGL